MCVLLTVQSIDVKRKHNSLVHSGITAIAERTRSTVMGCRRCMKMGSWESSAEWAIPLCACLAADQQVGVLLLEVAEVSEVTLESHQQTAEGVVDGDEVLADLLESVGGAVHDVVVVVGDGAVIWLRGSPALGAGSRTVSSAIDVEGRSDGDGELFLRADWEEIGVDVEGELALLVGGGGGLDAANSVVPAGVDLADLEDIVK